MTGPNDDIHGALSRWIAGPVPHHALLVEGPWGSGKTHLVRSILKQQSDGAALYVSLYGVQSVSEFERAVVRARWPTLDTRFGKLARQTKEFVSNSQILSTKFDLNAFSGTEFVMEDLPQLLVFDDLERSEMPMRSLMGMINRFVEHQGKHVIVLTNEAALMADEDRKPVYLGEKEKLIGRTLIVQPDAPSALSAIFSDISDPCCAFLRRHREDILDVFTMSGTNNLRLLRQALIEFSNVYGTLTADVTAHASGMVAFLRCYLALSFDVLSGRLTLEDLAQRDQSSVFGWGKRGQEEAKTPLGASFDRYIGIGIHAERSVLSLQAAVATIGKGQCPIWLSEDLLAGSAFGAVTETGEDPTWVRLWRWLDIPAAELEGLLGEVHQGLKDGTLHEPGEVLQVFGIYTSLSRNGIAPEGVDPVPWFQKLISDRAAAGDIPAREPGKGRSGSGYGYSTDMGTLSYGGYAYDLTDENLAVVNAMKAAQDAALAANLPNYTALFCDLLRTDPAEILGRFNGERRGDFWWNRSAVLKFTDVEEVTDTLIALGQSNPKICCDLIEAIKDRIVHYAMAEDERPWVAAARPLLIAKSKAVSATLGAQVGWAVSRYWDSVLDDPA